MHLHGAYAAARKSGGLCNRVPGLTQCDSTRMEHQIELSATLVPAGLLGSVDALSLALLAHLVVVTGHLQGELQKHRLHGLQNDLGHASRFSRQL